MAYEKQTWEDGNPAHPLSAARMGHIEDGVDTAHDLAESKADAAHAHPHTHDTTHEHDPHTHPRQTNIVNAEVDAAAAIAESKLALASDAAATTASRRTLGTTAPSAPGTAAAGNSLSAAPHNHVHPRQTTITNAEVSASAAIAESKLALASDAAQGTASRRTISTATPQPTGTATPGTATSASAADHVHASAGGVSNDSISNIHINSAAAIAESKLALASDAAAATASRRSLGTGATQAAPGDHAHAAPARQTNIVNSEIDAAAAIAESKLALATDAAAGTGSRRTLGTGATQAAAGNHTHTTARQTNIVDSEISATAAIQESKLSLASDAAAGTASRRTLGTGATQAAAGNDARLSDTRTPTDGTVTDAKVSGTAAIAESKLALASDAAQGTASRRTIFTGTPSALGTAAAGTGVSAAAGDHVHARPLNIVNSEISASAAIAESKLALASDAVATTASRRTLGTGAQQAAAGNHTHGSGGGTPDPGSVVDASLSTTGLTKVPGSIVVTSSAAARPAHAGSVIWLCDYSPFERPLNAQAGDIVVDNFGAATPANAVNMVTKMVTADQAVAVTTDTAINNLNFPCVGGKSYEFEATLILTSSATTVGPGLGFTGITATYFHAFIERQSSETAWVNTTTRAIGNATAHTAGLTTTYLVRVKGAFLCAGTGTFQLGIRANTAGTITVKSGSALKGVLQN